MLFLSRPHEAPVLFSFEFLSVMSTDSRPDMPTKSNKADAGGGGGGKGKARAADSHSRSAGPSRLVDDTADFQMADEMDEEDDVGEL